MTARTWTATFVMGILLAAGWIGAARLGPRRPLRSAHSEPATSIPPVSVVVTADGKTFHRKGCVFVHGPALPIAGGQAVAEGYTPCTRCLPR